MFILLIFDMSSIVFPTIPLNNKGTINADKPLFVICQDGLVRVNAKFYCDSSFCEKQTITMTAEQLKPYNTSQYPLTDCNTVLVLSTVKRDSLVETSVSDFNHLNRVIAMAAMYIINLHHLQNSYMLIGFLDDIFNEAAEFWKVNRVLLTNTDTREFEKFHYPTPGGNAAAVPGAAYNMPATPNPYVVAANKPYRITPMEISPEDPLYSFGPVDLGQLLETLEGLQLDQLIMRIFRSLLYHPRYCDLPMRCYMAKNIEKYPELEQYVFYAWRTLMLEEKSKFITSREDDRFLFYLPEMNYMPRFAVRYDNPYITILARGLRAVGTHAVEPMYLGNQRGLYSDEKFAERFNEYTHNIFKDLDWEHTAISGSAITACAIMNPLETNFKNFSSYCEEYYPSNPNFRHDTRDYPEFKPMARNIRAFTLRDSSDSDLDTLEAKEESVNTLDALETLEDDAKPLGNSPGKLAEKTDNVVPPPKPEYTDIDMMIECSTMAEFDAIVQKHYQTILKNSINPHDVTAGPSTRINLVKVDTENKYKWKITGLPREIDIFQVNSIPGVVVKFHMPCVRAWYNGNTVVGFPSFISAAMSGLNSDIRWVSCNKDIRDVLLKYYQRGFGFLLNPAEKTSMRDYMNNSPKWPNFNPPTQHWRARWYNCQTFLHENYTRLMNPSMYKLGIHYGIPGGGNRIAISANVTRERRRSAHQLVKSTRRNNYGFRYEHNPDKPVNKKDNMGSDSE